MPSSWDIIRSRRSPQIEAKLPIYKLLDDSYTGGLKYRQGGHLKKYPREWSEVYKQRKERAVYFNHIQPIVDILAGFLFKNPVERTLPTNLQRLAERVSKRKSIDQFSNSLAITSIMYTVGVLVDAPQFDRAAYPSEAARKEAGLDPYVCVYYPYQIRDFACDEDGALEWVLLDDSRTEKASALEPEKRRTIYRLWTKTHFQDFEIVEKQGVENGFEVIPGDEMPHPVGYVPFQFVNWRDVEDDHISDSPMEDIALLSEQIYNVLSLIDEQLHTSTFKPVIFPVAKRGDLPDDVIKAGVYDVPVVEFPAVGISATPYVLAMGASEIAACIDAIKFYTLEIFRKIGMDVDRDKSYVQSGAAMGKEFEKTAALLRFGSQALQDCEEFIFRTMGRWLDENYDDEVKITYSKTFSVDDIDVKLKRLYDVFNLGLRELKQLALKEIISTVLPKADAERLSKETEDSAPDFPVSGGAAAEALMQAREQFAITQQEATNV